MAKHAFGGTMDYENWYVFFVKTGKEKNVIEEIEKFFPNKEVLAKNLGIELLFKKRGMFYREIEYAFPGYLFVISSFKNDEFIIRTRELVSKSNWIIKLLCYEEKNRAVMNKEDVYLLRELWGDSDFICISEGKIIEGKLKIESGPLVGKEHLIKKISRHKRQAILEIEVLNRTRHMILGLNTRVE